MLRELAETLRKIADRQNGGIKTKWRRDDNYIELTEEEEQIEKILIEFINDLISEKLVEQNRNSDDE